MTHLLHEVKAELDWTARELIDAEVKLQQLEMTLQENILANEDPAARNAFISEIEAQKQALNLHELYALMSRAARRFSLLTRVFEIGSQFTDIDDLVTALTDGQLFRLEDTGDDLDPTIIAVAEALQIYFHGHFDNEADLQLREAWMKIEETLRRLGRKI